MYLNVTSISRRARCIPVGPDRGASRGDEIGEIHVGCGHMTFVHMAWEYRPAGWATAIFSASARCFAGLMPEPLKGISR
jgi:hypothetical protein